MKKALLTFLFFCTGMITAFLVSKPNTVAKATNEAIITTFAEELTSETASYYKNLYSASHNDSLLDSLQSGDYRMGVRITNNPGYASGVVPLLYDSDNYYVILVSDDPTETDAVIMYGEAGIGLSVIVDVSYAHPGYIAVSAVSGLNNTNSGEMVYFFLKRKPNADPNVTELAVSIRKPNTVMLADSENHDLPKIVEVTPEQQYHYIVFYYILGDINGDGEVDTVDSTVLQQILNYMTSHNATIEQACDYYSSVTAGIGTPELLYITLVTDVNYDNLINADDVEDIQEYYQFIVLEEPISSQIGQFMCFTMLVPITP